MDIRKLGCIILIEDEEFVHLRGQETAAGRGKNGTSRRMTMKDAIIYIDGDHKQKRSYQKT